MKKFLIILLLFFIFDMTHCCAAPIPVGASYGGGTVFCVSQTPDLSKCVPEGSGNYGLIMANEDLVNFDSNPNYGVTWASENKKTDAISVDDGAANTAAIIAMHPNDDSHNNAAWACHNYRDRAEGHTDWYLPARNELNKMYLYARSHNLIGRNCVGSKPGGIQCLLGGYSEEYLGYWSSTEYPGLYDYAWNQSFADGSQDCGGRDINWCGARAVRAFINLSIQPFNNLPQSQIREALERFIRTAEAAGEVNITKLQLVPDAENILTILNWLKTASNIKILNLTNLDLRGFIEPLCELLAVRTDFTTINFTNCNLNAVSIIRLLQNCRELTALYLGGNDIGDSAEEGVAKLTETLTVMIPNLENNPLISNGIKALVEVLQNNIKLGAIYLGWANISTPDAEVLLEALQNNPALIVYDLHNNIIYDGVIAGLNKIYSEKILLNLLRKIKLASAFTFMIGVRHNLMYILTTVLEYAGLNVRNRGTFEDVRDYDTAENRRIIFDGTLEEVIRLFYYGNHADYAETIREVNELRRQQREFLQRNGHEIPAGQLLELQEDLSGALRATLTPARVATVFWPVS